MMTAAEAQKLMKKHRDITEDKAILERLISRAAKSGYSSIRVPHKMCEFNGYSAKFLAKGLYELLIEKGYTISTESEDLQFVNVWIKVSW